MRAQWEKEKMTYEENLKAEKETINKLRKWEEEYTYAIQQKRKQEQDEYNLKKTRQEAELTEQKDTFEKKFAEREKVIRESEKELQDLRSQIEEFAKKM